MKPTIDENMVGLTAKGEPRQYVQHAYTDRRSEDDGPLSKKDEVILKQYDEDRVGGAFPLKLHIILKILEREGNDHIFSWLPHGRAFGIHRNGRFEEEVVKRFFKQSQISSFRRQLNLYGFIRISNGRDAGAYYHEYFLRGKPLLSLKMTRTRIKGTKIRASSSPDNEPLFYSMPFLGPCVRPEYAAQAAMEKKMMISSMMPTMMMGYGHSDRHGKMGAGAFHPYMNANSSPMMGAPGSSSTLQGYESTVSSSSLMKNSLVQQNQAFPPMMGDRAIYMNSSMPAASGMDSVNNMQLSMDRGRLQQEQRMLNLMGMNSGGNMMQQQTQSNMDYRNQQWSVDPMNIQSVRNVNNMNGMVGAPSNSSMQDRSSDTMNLMEQSMMSQRQPFNQFSRYPSDISSQNMSSALTQPSMSQGLQSEGRQFQSSSMQRQFGNQGINSMQNSSGGSGSGRDLLLHQQNSAASLMRESAMRSNYQMASDNDNGSGYVQSMGFNGNSNDGFIRGPSMNNASSMLSQNMAFLSKENSNNLSNNWQTITEQARQETNDNHGNHSLRSYEMAHNRAAPSSDQSGPQKSDGANDESSSSMAAV